MMEDCQRSPDVVLSITPDDGEAPRGKQRWTKIKCGRVWLIGLRMCNLYDTAQSVDHTCVVHKLSVPRCAMLVPCHVDEDKQVCTRGCMRTPGVHAAVVKYGHDVEWLQGQSSDYERSLAGSENAETILRTRRLIERTYSLDNHTH